MHDNIFSQAQAKRRFAEFRDHPKVRRDASRFEEWVRTDQGIWLNLLLSSYVFAFLTRDITKSEFKKVAVDLGTSSGLSRSDSKLNARCILEMTRAALVGTGQLSPGLVPDIEPEWGLS